MGDDQMANLIKTHNIYFAIGLLLRFLLILGITSSVIENWYAPFIESSIKTPSLDPWDVWLTSKGDPAAFPYGYVMWLVFLPLAALFQLFDLSSGFAYASTLLMVDFGVFTTLKKIYKKSASVVLYFYWLSPIVILATYVYGFNDLVPLFFLILSLYYLERRRMVFSGALCFLAISAKLSMILTLPFFFIWFFRNTAHRSLFWNFVIGFSIASFALGIPYLFSISAMRILVDNPEMKNVYFLILSIGEDNKIYLIPSVYLIGLYSIWKIRRINLDILLASFGAIFLLLVLLTPSPPGWYIWLVPFLLIYLVDEKSNTPRLIFLLFSSIYILHHIFFFKDTLVFSTLDLGFINFQLPFHLLFEKQYELTTTILFTAGFIMLASFFTRNIRNNNFHRFSKKPFVIGISGDSGAGKDTFSDALKKLFGSHSVAQISGDDYHLWDRHKPMWKTLTHLSPYANDLESFAKDILLLKDGKSIHPRHYDHQMGKMVTLPFLKKSNHIIIVSGLHSLYLPILRNHYDLSIFLDIDEELRRYFKIKRDTEERGHSMERVLDSLKAREPDTKKYIQSQKKYAELVLSMQPVNRVDLKKKLNEMPKLKLSVRCQSAMNELSLVRVLVGICGLYVEDTLSESGVEFIIEGEPAAEDILMAAEILCPKMTEFLDITPKWQDGILGLMQLITLTYINQKFEARLTV